MIYLTLFLEFFKVGLFTFGGGFAMIPLIKEVVLKYSWLTENEFYDFIGICESTPGPVAINMATYIGSLTGGILGSTLATLGVVLPSFIIILLIAAILKDFTQNKYFKGFLEGVKPVVIALITSTGFILLIKCVGYLSLQEFSFNIVPSLTFILLLIINFVSSKLLKKKISAIKLILLSALLGIVLSLVMERL